ncbi:MULTISPECIES: hypothetical protein [Acidobacteriaceae]|uniref:hypothetical protein n=1 Tax=Acidobacteriaceae TaxID=204434 RepID=UPI00131C3BA6|nr:MULTISPECIES: hypothetical protein [Acidobacteriaceae]MDW5267829.1 hypothetical protein [Edaphobacter sp.]
MTGEQTLVARAALGIFAGAVSIPAVRSRRLHDLPRQAFERLITISFIASRIGLWLFVFFVLRVSPRGDVTIYMGEAQKALLHLMPYRDFVSSYAPLHSYMDALLVGFFRTPLSLILFAILVESLLLPLWFRAGRTFLSDRELRTGAILYLTSAVSLQFVAIDGQDNIIIAVLLALAMLLVQRRRAFSSGVAVGVGVALLKFLPLLYVPAFFLAVPRRWRWVGGLGVLVAVVYGSVAMAHAPLLQPLLREGSLRTSADIPFLIEGATGATLPSSLWNGLLLALLALTFGLIAKACYKANETVRLRVLTFAVPALTLTLILFAKKSWPPYLMLTLLPLCLLISNRHRLGAFLFAIFGVVAVVEHSYYATILHAFSAPEFHQGLLAHDPHCLVFLGIEILLLAGYGWLLLASVQQIVAVDRIVRREHLPVN